MILEHSDTVNAEVVDTTTLLKLAEQCGFPRVVVEYPDGKSRLHIAGSRDGWKLALPYLQRDGVLQSAHHALCNPPIPAPPLPAPPPLPEVFQNRTPLVWNLLDDWFPRIFHPDDWERIRVMLAYAEACNYPELTLPDYHYTIPNDMAGWLTAAGLMAGTPAVALATRMLHARVFPQPQLPLLGEERDGNHHRGSGNRTTTHLTVG